MLYINGWTLRTPLVSLKFKKLLPVNCNLLLYRALSELILFKKKKECWHLGKRRLTIHATYMVNPKHQVKHVEKYYILLGHTDSRTLLLLVTDRIVCFFKKSVVHPILAKLLSKVVQMCKTNEYS